MKKKTEAPVTVTGNDKIDRFTAAMGAINSLGVDATNEALAEEALKLHKAAGGNGGCTLKDFVTVIKKTKAAMTWEPANATTHMSATLDAIKELGVDAETKVLAEEGDRIYRETRKCDAAIKRSTEYVRICVTVLKLAAERGIKL